MKLKTVFVAALAALLLSACNTTEKLLCRSWKVADVSFDPQNTLNLTPEKKAMMINQLKDTTVISIRKDKTYTFRLPEKTISGTWKLEDKTIVTTTDMTVSKSLIKRLDKAALIIESNDNNIPITYILTPVQ
jgi:hypothetical protein